MEVYEENASMCCEELSKVPGLKAVKPAGAMYMTVRDSHSLGYYP